jgi:transcriptional regulator with XRE-family HTH domain
MSIDRPDRGRLPRPEKERTLAIAKSVFAHRLWQAIKRSGLTYRETARLAQAHLPSGQRMSDVSVWSYAKGRSLPRRMVQIEALAQVLGVEVADLVEETDALRKPPAQREAGANVADLGDGRAHLRVDLETRWPVALEVLRLLKVADPAPGADDGSAQPSEDDAGA